MASEPPFRVAEPPYVSFLQFCDAVIKEPDKGPTLVRVSNNIKARQRPGETKPPVVDVTLLLAMSSVPVEPPTRVELWHLAPSGEWDRIHAIYVGVSAGNAAGNVMIELPIELEVEVQGTHAISVVVGGREITRAPMTLVVIETPALSATTPAEPESPGSARAEEVG